MDPLSKRVFALKVVSVVGVVFAVVGVFSIIIGAHDFVPAYEELTAMQAMAEAAMAAAAAAQGWWWHHKSIVPCSRHEFMVSGLFILYNFNLCNFTRGHFNRSQFQAIAFSAFRNFDLN